MLLRPASERSATPSANPAPPSVMPRRMMQAAQGQTHQQGRHAEEHEDGGNEHHLAVGPQRHACDRQRGRDGDHDDKDVTWDRRQ